MDPAPAAPRGDCEGIDTGNHAQQVDEGQRALGAVAFRVGDVVIFADAQWQPGEKDRRPLGETLDAIAFATRASLARAGVTGTVSVVRIRDFDAVETTITEPEGAVVHSYVVAVRGGFVLINFGASSVSAKADFDAFVTRSMDTLKAKHPDSRDGADPDLIDKTQRVLSVALGSGILAAVVIYFARRFRKRPR